MTTYYGKDYQDGRGLAAPDVDNDCQLIVIYDIDGLSILVVTLLHHLPVQEKQCSLICGYNHSWGKSIIAHELQFTPNANHMKICGLMKEMQMWQFTYASVEIQRLSAI